MYRLGPIFFSAFLLLASPAAAKDVHQDLWIVSQLSGEARVVHGGFQSASLRVNSTLYPGDVVITGASGRAMLSHNNADYIVVAPRSEMRLPAESQPSGFTRIIENVGTILFRVQHTGVPHFAVDTPMLAAVVKGTTFTIIVDRDRSAVQVTQGVVEVSANSGGMKQLVEGGRTVFIDRHDPKTIIDADTPTQTSSNSPATGVRIAGSRPVSLTTIAGLMSGLVRPEAATPAAPVASPATVVVATAPVSGVSTVASPTTNAVGSTASPVTATLGTVAAPVTSTAPVTDTVGTVTAPVTGTISTVTAPVAETVGTVTAPVTSTITTVTAPVTDTVGTVTAPVTSTISTVTAPVTDIVGTVTAPVTGTITTTTSPAPPAPSVLSLHF